MHRTIEGADGQGYIARARKTCTMQWHACAAATRTGIAWPEPPLLTTPFNNVWAGVFWLPPAFQVSYAKLVNGLANANIQLNRKVLSELAMTEPFSFKALVDQVKSMKGLVPRSQATATGAAAGQAGTQPQGPGRP